MEVKKQQVDDVLKTLPIGFYLGRKASVRLDEKAPTSVAEVMTDSLVIAMRNVTAAADALPPSAEKYWDVERLTRCILYHEVGHLIYTPPTLRDFMYRSSVPGLGSYEICDGLNIIEDERIERRLQPAILGVDFPNFVKLACGHAPGETITLPKKASPRNRLFYAVRFHVGSEADLLAVDNLWTMVASLGRTVLRSSDSRAVNLLRSYMIALVEYFYSTEPTEDDGPNPENVDGPESHGSDRKNGGEKEDESESPEMPNGDGGEGGGDADKSGDNGDNGEKTDKTDDGDSGSDSRKDAKPEKSESEDGGYGKNETDGSDGNDGAEGKSGTTKVDRGGCDSENSVECEGESPSDAGGRGRSFSEEESKRDQDALEGLRKDISDAFDWNELPDSSPVKKSLARLVKRYRTRAGSARGEREEYATGRVNARAVCLGEDKLFRDRGHGSGNGSQKIALTAWIDVSGSFSYAGPKLNQVLKALRRTERESNGMLVVDVVAVGEDLNTSYNGFVNMIADQNPGRLRVDAAILKKDATVDPFCDNILSEDYNWCHKKTRHPDARQFDIVVFDGWCTDGVNKYLYEKHIYPCDKDALQKIPEQSDIEKEFSKTEIDAAKIWDNPRTFIISDWANAPLFNAVCKTARKKYMDSNYADELEKLVAEVLEKL